MNNTDFESWLRDGCGRCEHYRTPSCKVHHWTDALIALRAMLQQSGLAEEMKWGSPCYTRDGRNVVMLAALRDSCMLSFFQGAELVDDAGGLERPGPNSRHARLLRFRSLGDVERRSAVIRGLVEQAIALEASGTRPVRVVEVEPLPAELARRLAEDPVLGEAFDALTPGRRRSHILHVSGAKQAETRERRVERCVPDILAGRGFNERDS